MAHGVRYHSEHTIDPSFVFLPWFLTGSEIGGCMVVPQALVMERAICFDLIFWC